jgi:hypothetical protein
MRYAITYLKGDIKYFFQSMLEQPAKFNENYPNWQTFRNYVVNTYGEGSLSQVAKHEIRALHQTSSVSNYRSQFSAIASRLSWNEDALFSQFRQGLSDRIKDLESQLPQPLTTLHTLKEWAVNVDNRMYQRQLEKKAQTSTTKPPTNFNRSPNLPASSSPKPPSSSNQRTNDANNEQAHSKPVPINIDASKIRAPLTEAQKEERRRLGLCMYCGDKDHQVFNCPKRVKLSANAASITSPVPESKPEEPKIVELGN